MGWLAGTLGSSIGRKFLMGLSGLALWFYLAVHLAGNLAFFLGQDAFNGYAHFLESLPIVRPVELGLAAVFLVHIILGITLTFLNRTARAGRYAVKGTKSSNTLSSKTMIFSGIVTLAFLIIHLWQFRFADPLIDAHGHKDFYAINIAVFSNLFYCTWYVFAVSVLGFHVGHGFQSAFRSLGFLHDKYQPLVRIVGLAAAVIFSLGFSSIPLWVIIAGKGA